MSSFIKFIIFCMLFVLMLLLHGMIWVEIKDFFTYITLVDISSSIFDIPRNGIILNMAGHIIFIKIICGLFLILISILPIIFYKEHNNKNYSINEYILFPAFCVGLIWCGALFFGGFWYMLDGVAVFLYLNFGISFFLEYSPLWILGILFIVISFYLQNKDKVFLLELKKKAKSYTFLSLYFLILISIIGSIVALKPEPFYFNDGKFCKGNQCYLYSDIKNINIDQSGYKLEIILKSFDTKLPITFSRGDMFNKEECDSDGDTGGHSWCWPIHKPILDINDRLTFIVKEDEDSYGRISSEELSYFGEQKNFEKTLNAVVSGKIHYPDTLSQDWIMVLKLLNKKTNLYPKVINSI